LIFDSFSSSPPLQAIYSMISPDVKPNPDEPGAPPARRTPLSLL